MYCPNCAAPIDGVKFCRACGANVSLVSQAMAGRPVEATEAQDPSARKRKRRGRKPPSLEKGIEGIGWGLGLLLASLGVLTFFPGGHIWWFWLLIPAFGCLGDGIGHLVRLKYEPRLNPPDTSAPAAPPAPYFSQLPAPLTSESAPPASITEDTTRRIEATMEQPQEKV